MLKTGGNMRKRVLLLFLYCLLIKNSILIAQAEEKNYFLNDIDKAFIGYYISVDFIETFEKTKNYYFSMNSNSDYPYFAHIIVRENGIDCYPFYSDGYFEVSEDEYKDYLFEYFSADKIIITEPNGKKYKRMTNLYDWENYMAIMNNYVGSIVLADIINTGKIHIKNDFIYIPQLNNKKLKIDTWQTYYNNDIDLVLTDYDLEYEWRVFLKIKDNELTIYYDPPFWHNGEKFDVILKIKI
jgi:hypothetical protein